MLCMPRGGLCSTKGPHLATTTQLPAISPLRPPHPPPPPLHPPLSLRPFTLLFPSAPSPSRPPRFFFPSLFPPPSDPFVTPQPPPSAPSLSPLPQPLTQPPPSAPSISRLSHLPQPPLSPLFAPSLTPLSLSLSPLSPLPHVSYPLASFLTRRHFLRLTYVQPSLTRIPTRFAVALQVRTLPCLHTFHAECAEEWLKKKKVDKTKTIVRPSGLLPAALLSFHSNLTLYPCSPLTLISWLTPRPPHVYPHVAARSLHLPSCSSRPVWFYSPAVGW